MIYSCHCDESQTGSCVLITFANYNTQLTMELKVRCYCEGVIQ